MSFIYNVDTYVGPVECLLNTKGFLPYVKCLVTGEQGRCLSLGTTFSTYYLSDIVIGAAKELNYDLTTKEGLKLLLNQRLDILNQIKNSQNKINLFIAKEKDESNKWREIVITTGDIKDKYEIIGPVYFQISNKGFFGGTFSSLELLYKEELNKLKEAGQLSNSKPDWGFIYGEFSVGQNQFDRAFYIAAQELKKRASMLGADAIIAMRQDIDLDTTNIAHFYLQMYGTAIKYLFENEIMDDDSIERLS